MPSFVDPFDVDDPTTGQDILAAYDDAVRQALMALAAPPTVRARRETLQTVNNETDTGIACDVLDYDSHAMHSVIGGVSRFTVPAGWPGGFDVGMNTNWQANNVNKRSIFIQLTRVATSTTKIIAGISEPTGFDGYLQQSVSTHVQVAAGDYFEFFAWQDWGSALNLEPIEEAMQSIWADWYRLPYTVAA